MENREYNKKYSRALIAITNIKTAMMNAKIDINFLGRKDIDGSMYSKTKLQEDFEKIEQAFEKEYKYLLELTKELQKQHKMH